MIHSANIVFDDSLWILSEVQEYWRNYLLPVTSQPSQHASVPASLLENHISELSAAQEWENEWNSQGLLSRLTPEVFLFPPSSLKGEFSQKFNCYKFDICPRYPYYSFLFFDVHFKL